MTTLLTGMSVTEDGWLRADFGDRRFVMRIEAPCNHFEVSKAMRRLSEIIWSDPALHERYDKAKLGQVNSAAPQSDAEKVWYKE